MYFSEKLVLEYHSKIYMIISYILDALVSFILIIVYILEGLRGPFSNHHMVTFILLCLVFLQTNCGALWIMQQYTVQLKQTNNLSNSLY